MSLLMSLLVFFGKEQSQAVHDADAARVLGVARQYRHSALAGSRDLEDWARYALEATLGAYRERVLAPLLQLKDELFKTFRCGACPQAAASAHAGRLPTGSGSPSTLWAALCQVPCLLAHWDTLLSAMQKDVSMTLLAPTRTSDVFVTLVAWPATHWK